MNAGNVRVGGAIGFRINFLTQVRHRHHITKRVSCDHIYHTHQFSSSRRSAPLTTSRLYSTTWLTSLRESFPMLWSFLTTLLLPLKRPEVRHIDTTNLRQSILQKLAHGLQPSNSSTSVVLVTPQF